MHGHPGGLLTAAGVRGIRQTSVTISGAGLDWHDMGAHFKPGTGMLRCSFSSSNDVAFTQFERAYDMVLMMDCSQCPIHPTLQQAFYDTAKAHATTVRQAGAEPALFLSWACQDQPQMTDQLVAACVKVGRANGLAAPAHCRLWSRWRGSGMACRAGMREKFTGSQISRGRGSHRSCAMRGRSLPGGNGCAVWLRQHWLRLR